MTADMLDRVGAFVGRFVVLPSEAARIALALYVLHTHAIDAAEATPYLLVLSPERQSGKTRLLEVAELLVRSPWRVAGASEAALFRRIERDRPSLLLDEIDAVFASSTERVEPLRCLLNAGNRHGASVSRVVAKGKSMEVVDFAVFCPKMLAGIDSSKLPETLTDRSVTIKMQRRRDGERVERLRYRHASRDAEPIREALQSWATAAVEQLRDAEPELPDELGDRQADAWEPLLAIADHAGGEWPIRARAAAVELSAPVEGEEVGRGAQLLAVTREALGDCETISTADLLASINADDELPFGGWRDGKGLDARGLARLLRPYDIRPRTVRIGETTAKGYTADGLRDVFARYLPGASQASPPTHPEEPPTENPHEYSDVTHVTDVTAQAGAGHGNLAGAVCVYAGHAGQWRPHPDTGRVICWRCHPPAREPA
ncbi:MAG TPA: DUF3631 domain-containing protein [Solirubrobacteraceae bacterium]|nr:DUF3631 domain-containing protein [Solirubrobacteraceae bacterium]